MYFKRLVGEVHGLIVFALLLEQYSRTDHQLLILRMALQLGDKVIQ